MPESLHLHQQNLATMERLGWQHLEQVAAAIAHHREQVDERQETPLAAFASIIQTMGEVQAFLAQVGVAYCDAFCEVLTPLLIALAKEEADVEDLGA